MYKPIKERAYRICLFKGNQPESRLTKCFVFAENGVRKIVRGCYFGDVNATDVGCKMDPTLTAVQNSSCYVCDNENYCNGAEGPVDKWKIFGSLVLFLLAPQLL